MNLVWDAFPTPLGTAVAVFSRSALLSLSFTDSDPEHFLERIALAARALPAHRSGAADDLAHQIEEYFSGTRFEFDIPLDFSLITGFSLEATRAICTIPYGETMSYGEVAVQAGHPRAARAVGTACRTAPISLVVPVHRVIRASGAPGEYGGQSEVRSFLIDHEREHSAPRD